MAIRVRAATTEEDREKVYRLRYDIYVEERGRKQTYADHSLPRYCQVDLSFGVPSIVAR